MQQATEMPRVITTTPFESVAMRVYLLPGESCPAIAAIEMRSGATYRILMENKQFSCDPAVAAEVSTLVGRKFIPALLNGTLVLMMTRETAEGFSGAVSPKMLCKRFRQEWHGGKPCLRPSGSYPRYENFKF